jgi:hypothetical protein
MRPFQVDGSTYIRINGKSFYLLRGYTVRHDKFVFVQVFGRGALTKDDLPERNWEVITTKGPQGKVYTAWKPGYFDGSNETRLFLGATLRASLWLLLVAHTTPERVTSILVSLIEDDRVPYNSGIQVYDDKGDSGVSAVSVERAYQFTEWLRTHGEGACPTH